MDTRPDARARCPRLLTLRLVAVALACIARSASGGSTDPNERNFGAALTQYLEKQGRLCLGQMRWPRDLPLAGDLQHSPGWRRESERMVALEAAGLVRGEDVEVQQKQGIAMPTTVRIKVRRYSLTNAAAPFTQIPEFNTSGLRNEGKDRDVDLCWGRKGLDKVVKWEGPLKLGDYQAADVIYTYSVSDVAAWARMPQIQAAFPSIRSLLDSAGTAQLRRGVTLTGAGWEAKGMKPAPTRP